jgi:hypothetical protein
LSTLDLGAAVRGRVRAARSSGGAIMWHGPHRGAQKSTTAILGPAMASSRVFGGQVGDRAHGSWCGGCVGSEGDQAMLPAGE